MRIAIFALVALLVLTGAGAGGYYYFSNKKAEAAPGGEVEIHHEAKKEEKSELDKALYEYVRLDPLILPIIDNNGVAQTVSMVVSLEVVNNKKATELQSLAPRIKSAFIQDMYGVLNRHAALKGGVIQVSTLKKRLSKIGDKVAGKDVINDVVLQVVQQRPVS